MQQQLTDTLRKAGMHKSVLVFVKVEELQKRLMAMEEEASAARSAATESLRLTDENTLLGNQLKQMEFNLKAKFLSPKYFRSPLFKLAISMSPQQLVTEYILKSHNVISP